MFPRLSLAFGLSCCWLVFPALGDDTVELKRLLSRVDELARKVDEANQRIQDLEEQVSDLKASVEKKDSVDNENQVAKNGDSFAVGETWSGTRTVDGYKPHGCQLIVTSRKRSEFEGTLTFVAGDLKKHELSVKGSAPTAANGRVFFKTSTKDLLQQTFKGKLAGGQISLSFDGSASDGKAVSGTVVMSPKDAEE